MCIKSRNHFCWQSFLLLILVLSFLIFSLSIICHFGMYFASTPEDKSQDLIALSAGESPADDVEIFKNYSQSNKFGPDWVLRTNCSWIQTQIDTGKLFGICDEANTDSSKLECFRTTILYTGFASILPTSLVLLSIISVCRLLLCPIIFLGIIYLVLAIGILLVSGLYHDSVILNALSVSGTLTPLAYQLISLAVLYIIIAFLHTILFSFILCERKNASSSKGMKHSSSDDENGLDIDDPRAPLYGYSSKPGSDFDERVKDFKYIDDDMSYILKK